MVKDERRRVGGFPHDAASNGTGTGYEDCKVTTGKCQAAGFAVDNATRNSGDIVLNSVCLSVRITTQTRDEIHRVLAAHYGFSDEELDFIPSTKLMAGIPSAQLRAGINYDIKYRMGRDVENDEG